MGLKQKDGCCKKFMKFLFSHVGLCVMVILYCVAGGFIFEHLEKNNEEQICYDSRDEYIDMEERTLNNTIKVIKEQEGSGQTDVLVIQLQSILATFRDNSIAIGFDGKNCTAYGETDGPKYKWSWSGALFFSVTVISTIGKFSKKSYIFLYLYYRNYFALFCFTDSGELYRVSMIMR